MEAKRHASRRIAFRDGSVAPRICWGLGQLGDCIRRKITPSGNTISTCKKKLKFAHWHLTAMGNCRPATCNNVCDECAALLPVSKQLHTFSKQVPVESWQFLIRNLPVLNASQHILRIACAFTLKNYCQALTLRLHSNSRTSPSLITTTPTPIPTPNSDVRHPKIMALKTALLHPLRLRMPANMEITWKLSLDMQPSVYGGKQTYGRKS